MTLALSIYQPRAMPNPKIVLHVCYGTYGQKSKTISVEINEELMRELSEGVELSDDPTSLLLASPGVSGVFGGYGDAVTIRQRKFEMRREIAEMIAADMVPALLQAFAVNDRMDGYRMDELSDRTRHA